MNYIQNEEVTLLSSLNNLSLISQHHRSHIFCTLPQTHVHTATCWVHLTTNPNPYIFPSVLTSLIYSVFIARRGDDELMAELILAHKLRLREEAVQPMLTQHSCFSLCQQRQLLLLFSSFLLFPSLRLCLIWMWLLFILGLGLGLGLGYWAWAQ